MLILCLTVFFCRILDVSLGTIRTLFTVKSKIWYAGLIGFIELLVWFLVVREALSSDESSIWVAIAYAAGYASGTIIGGLLSRIFIKTNQEVQVVTSNTSEEFMQELKDNNFACTITPARGLMDPKERLMYYFVIDSKRFNELKAILLKHDPKAFITVNEANRLLNGYFLNKKSK